MASRKRNIEVLYNNFGESANIILNKLESDNIKFTDKSHAFMYEIGNTILNYIDFMNEGNSDVIENKTISEIQDEYLEWLTLTKTNFKFNEYTEYSDILLDYRVGSVGHYWVDLKSSASSDMMFRMNNCGRVGGANLILLREQTNDGNNFIHVAIVIGSGTIYQIKGPNNSKPLNKYDYIFDFLMKYDPIYEFKKVFQPEFDFSITDLKKDDLESFKLKNPHIFKKELI
jgi:hypothetical protein